ncbi:MAG TPA: MFS transporter [Thermoleophilaceae bacterium]|nr:MFS transporter [Thermoleophilaceae bacterium]
MSFNLRIGIVAVGPVVDDIRASTGMSSGTAGLLGAVPFLCMGVFALVGPPIAARLGSVRLIGYALALLLLGTLARAAAPGAALVVLGTVPIGVGIALTGLALPGVVKLYFPGRPGAATGGYVAALGLGGGLAALLVVPLAHALGGWRGAFAVTALPALLALPVWMRVAARVGDGPQPAAGLAAPGGTRWRPGPQGVRLGVMFGLQSMCFAAVISWVAALYHQAGWSAGHAALTAAVISLLVAPAGLVLPRLSDGRDRRPWVLGTAVVMASAVLAIAVAPRTGSWLWVIAFGLGTGSIFSLMLTMPLDMRDTQSEIDELTGWMLGIGYIMSAAAPALVGAGRDLTGNFELPLIIMSVLGFGAGIVAMSPLLRPVRSGGSRLHSQAAASAAEPSTAQAGRRGRV